MSGMANHNAARPRNDRIWVAAPSWPEAKSPCQRGIPGLPQHPMTHRRLRGRGVWPSARTSVEQPFRRSDEPRSLRGRRRRAARSARRIRTSPAPAAAATPTPAMLLSASPAGPTRLSIVKTATPMPGTRFGCSAGFQAARAALASAGTPGRRSGNDVKSETCRCRDVSKGRVIGEPDHAQIVVTDGINHGGIARPVCRPAEDKVAKFRRVGGRRAGAIRCRRGSGRNWKPGRRQCPRNGSADRLRGR